MRASKIGTVAAFLLSLAVSSAHAQWLNYPTPGIPRTKDGKPNLINFQVENGVYIVPKIIDSGYLAVGKKKITFTRHG